MNTNSTVTSRHSSHRSSGSNRRSFMQSQSFDPPPDSLSSKVVFESDSGESESEELWSLVLRIVKNYKKKIHFGIMFHGVWNFGSSFYELSCDAEFCETYLIDPWLCKINKLQTYLSSLFSSVFQVFSSPRCQPWNIDYVVVVEKLKKW